MELCVFTAVFVLILEANRLPHQHPMRLRCPMCCVWHMQFRSRGQAMCISDVWLCTSNEPLFTEETLRSTKAKATDDIWLSGLHTAPTRIYLALMIAQKLLEPSSLPIGTNLSIIRFTLKMPMRNVIGRWIRSRWKLQSPFPMYDSRTSVMVAQAMLASEKDSR